jgi:hypothetical protein
MQALYALSTRRDFPKSPTSIKNLNRHRQFSKLDNHNQNVVSITPPPAQLAVWYAQAYIAA